MSKPKIDIPMLKQIAENAIACRGTFSITGEQAMELINSYDHNEEPICYIFKHPMGPNFWSRVDKSCAGDEGVVAVYERPKLESAQPIAFTHKCEISNMEATGLYLRAWPTDRSLNAEEGYNTPLYTTPPLNHTEQHMVVPDGWKLVPMNPTEAMLNASVTDYCRAGKYTTEDTPYELRRQVELEAESTYKAMLSAAPKPESE